MATSVQSDYRSPVGIDSASVKGLAKTNSATQLKEKKSLGKKIIGFFKKPFTKASTANEIPLDQRTDISGSQHLEKPQAKWNPYQQPAHGQIFVPGSIAVIRQNNETVAFVPGNIAVAMNKPGLDMNNVPMLIAQNQVQEIDQVLEETPKITGELSPKFEVMSPKYNPVDVAAQINDVEHMNEKDAELYGNLRESRMLYASSTMNPTVQGYPSSVKKPTMYKANGVDKESIRGSRTFA